MNPDSPNKQKQIIAIAIALDVVKMVKAGESNEQVTQFLLAQTNGDMVILSMVAFLLNSGVQEVQS